MDVPTVQTNDNFSQDPKIWDVVIVGGGVAGAALANTLGKGGRKVLMLEKDLRQPDRIVGELLQPGGYLALTRMGLQDAVKGIDAQKVNGYAIFKDDEDFSIEYPLEEYSDDVSGRSFHHGRFVQSLRQMASKIENVTVRQGTVKNLLNVAGDSFKDEDFVGGVSYKDSEGRQRTCSAHLTFVCDGMYSSLRRTLIQPNIQSSSYFAGIKIRNCNLKYPNHGHVLLIKPSAVLVYPISSDVSRVLVDVPVDKLPSRQEGGLQEYFRGVIAPQLPEWLRKPFLDAVEEGDIRSVQNKQMGALPVRQTGAVMLGDAYNMRHPLTGGGMTVALSDCALLTGIVESCGDLSEQEEVAEKFKNFHSRRTPLSGTINTLAGALHSVFLYTGDGPHEEMRQACFDYLKMGGMYAQGPISLLAGLNPNPLVLVMHFFMVAFYGITSFSWRSSAMRLVNPRQWSLRIRLLADAVGIITPLVMREGLTMFIPKYFTST